eukprot:GDKJ01016281.1.p1 GENE.GDKJ01016281.1~~GDKJ01016281.1.p1  ORF type:complete len:105 (+),score=18.24 GDKJ01016281.1:210-524(+)
MFSQFIKTATASASEKDQTEILNSFQKLILKKNDYFVEENAVCTYFCFVENGILQHSIEVLGEEKTTYLALRNSFTSSLQSFLNQTKSRKNIKALVETVCGLWT